MRFRFLLTLFVGCFWCSTPAFAQDNTNAVIFHIQSAHAPFPDSARMNGHVGDSVFYSTADHYHDSTVLIIAPKNLDAKKKVDLIFWFHGWHNNVDNSASYYQLTRQFIHSKLNAVLILPEAAKNAADSYGGKLEKPGVFKALVADVLTGLKEKNMIGRQCEAGHILLGGHSGGGRVIGRMVKNGQMEINQIVLFDAMYSETETFMTWIKADTTHKFIDMYTNYGYGPDSESHKMAKMLQQQSIPYIETEEIGLTPAILDTHRLIIIHSLSQHNDIIFKPDNFELFFGSSPFLKKVGN
jgi:hypothetical protein